MIILDDKVMTARKVYKDDAYEAIMFHYEDDMFSYQELREIVKIKKQNGKIKPGQKYRRLVYKDDGKLLTWRESIPMSKIYYKYELYDDW